MTTKSNRVGWGNGAFGSRPWGWGDWAEVMLWNFLPVINRQADAQRHYQELRSWVDALKPSAQLLREKVEFFFDIRDPLDAPESLLSLLANDFGLVDDKSNVEERRRAAIFSAFQIYLNKGTELGYRIVGAFTNVDVAVEGLWENPCESENYQAAGPTRFTPQYDVVPADVYEDMFDDFFPAAGSVSLTLRFNSASEVELLAVTEVRELVGDTVLTTPADYTVSLPTGVVTLTASAAAGQQYRVTMDVNIPTDLDITDEFALWPAPVEAADGVCRTNRLVVTLTRVPGAVSEVPASLSEVLAKLTTFKPAHVVFHQVNYIVDVPVSFAPTVELTS